MIFFFKYIEQFLATGTPEKIELSERLSALRSAYDVFNGGNPEAAFTALIDTYNWMGQPATKARHGITENLARNLPGAMFQDYLLHLAVKLCAPYPTLETFTEVRVIFGKYPLWSTGEVAWKTPAEYSDLAIGYIMDGEAITINNGLVLDAAALLTSLAAQVGEEQAAAGENWRHWQEEMQRADNLAAELAALKEKVGA